MVPRRALPLLSCIYLALSAMTGGNPKQIPISNLAEVKTRMQQEVRQAFQLPVTTHYLPENYSIKDAVIKAYPTCFFDGTPDLLNKNFNINNNIFIDTIPCYASIYKNNKIILVATANKLTGSYYSFYPVNPPINEKNKGIGSRNFSDYDVRLIQAAAQHSETAFFFKFYPSEFKTPDVIGFYVQNKIYFIDSNQVVYSSFNDIIKSRYGSIANFSKILAESSKAKDK